MCPVHSNVSYDSSTHLAKQAGFDSKDPHIASCKNNLAEFYRNTRQYDKAERLYKEVQRTPMHSSHALLCDLTHISHL
jgi:hypothetical protein